MARQKLDKNPFLTQKPFNSYPIESLEGLGLISDIKKLPGLYVDSSSQVWEFTAPFNDYDQQTNSFILKNLESCSTKPTVPFWQAMELLFDLSLKKSYLRSNETRHYVSQHSVLTIPKVYDLLLSSSACAIVLEKLDAVTFTANNVDSQNVDILAQYLARLHHQQAPVFGVISSELKPGHSDVLEQWQSRLKTTLTHLANGSKLAKTTIESTIKAVDELEVTHIVPLMMDTRWDQFAQNQGRLVGVFDLDAYVFAPIELDFVILEYLLDAQQAEQFLHTYQLITGKKIILQSPQRSVYRVLFYLMNALGQSDFKQWMSQPAYFAG